MQPIFKELIQMWSDLNCPLPIEEGRFWLDNHFVIAFDNTGGQHKLYKYKVFDDLSIEIKPYESCESYEFETWEQTIRRLEPELSALKEESLGIIQKAIDNYGNHRKAVFTSTGKDSMVVLDLVQKLIPDVEVYFNNTTLDVSDTYKMVQSNNWSVINPDIGFYRYIFKEHFIPTRFSRGCCTHFKEGRTISYFKNESQMLFFMGVRNEESAARANREDFSKNPKWGERDWISCLPIRKWSEFHVWLYILKYGLDINPKYRKGYTRVGCAIACPYYTKYTWVLDKYWYRDLYDRWQAILREDFVREQRWVKLNCTVDEYVRDGWCGGLYRPEPSEEVVKEFMEYKGFDDESVARQYFNKVCEVCGKNVRRNEVLAMNLKLHGRNVNKIYCKKHLCELHKMNNEEWNNAISDFKREGCALF